VNRSTGSTPHGSRTAISASSVTALEELSRLRKMTSRFRYECPYHKVGLVLEVVKLSPFGKAMTNCTSVEFYRCPVTKDQSNVNMANDGSERCNFMKPNKWQRYPISNDPRAKRLTDGL
jgi:hypothetical protein